MKAYLQIFNLINNKKFFVFCFGDSKRASNCAYQPLYSNEINELLTFAYIAQIFI